MSSEPAQQETKPLRLFFREAVARAVREEMARDPKVLLMGQDVGSFGGSYREFDGVYGEFGPDRVRDTPVAEPASVGIAAGVAAAGFRPLTVITYMDFLMLGFDALINYAAKLRYKSAGKLTAPMVVKTTAGAQGQGVAHSQCIEAWLISVPGLAVVAPSTPADAYGLMKSALRHDGPVVYMDHKKLFPTPGNLDREEHVVPFGKAAIRQEGTDVTLTCHSYMVRVALQAAEALAEEGISVEVIDLRSLAPLDIDTLVASVEKTGKLLTLEEGQVTCGVGVEVATRIFEAVGYRPWKRLGALPAPVSSNPVLEAECIPDAEQVIESIRVLVRG